MILRSIIFFAMSGFKIFEYQFVCKYFHFIFLCHTIFVNIFNVLTVVQHANPIAAKFNRQIFNLYT